MVPPLCASVLRVPSRLGALQNVLARVTQAIAPCAAVRARHARQAPVNALDATPWSCLHTLAWRWVMASEGGACAALLEAWAGVLVRDGSGV
jgi:hypothetical protein